MYSSTVIFQPLSAVLSFSAGVNYCIPALLISSPTQLFSVYQQDLLLYSSTVNFQLHTAVLRLLARNKYSFPVLTCIFSCILFFPHFLINEPIFSGHFYITDTGEGSQRSYLWYFYNYKSNSFHCNLKWFNFWNTVNFSTNPTTPVQSMSITNNKYGELQITSILYSASNVFLTVIFQCFLSIYRLKWL